MKASVARGASLGPTRAFRSALLELSPERAVSTGGFVPRWVTEIDLAWPVADLVAPDPAYDAARVLVRVNRQPVGFLDMPVVDGRIDASELVVEAHAELGEALVTLRRAAPCALSRERFVSVVVPTRERPASLRRCLRTLLAVDYPAFEVLVVDNGAVSTNTARIIRDLSDNRVVHVTEPVAGASRARNRGIQEASGEIIAFLDDDVLVDANWLRGIVRGFERGPQVGCVTGLVACAELETEAQAYFDTRVTWSTSCESRLFDLGPHAVNDPLYPFMPGVIGTGANFAISREAARLVGPFDEALGPGTPACSGEDLDLFFRVLMARVRIAYEPEGLVWHVHRRERAALRLQLRGYGAGLGALAFKHLVAPSTSRAALRRVPRGARRLTAGRAAAGASAATLPRHLVAVELLTMLTGPIAYLLGRRRARAH